MDQSIPFTLLGFDHDQLATAAVDRVTEVVQEIAESLSFFVHDLDGITIAHNYDAALAALDRGLKTSSVLTRTNDSAVSGCSMAPCVLRNGKIKTHIVLNSSVVSLIDEPKMGVSGRYIIAHEMAHVHEHTLRNHLLPGTLLAPIPGSIDEVQLFKIAETCWSEYAACSFSAQIFPEQIKIFEQTLTLVLKDARAAIAHAKASWVKNRDYGLLWTAVAQVVIDLMKYSSYLLGHVVGIDEQVEKVTPDLYLLIQDNEWFTPTFERLDEALATMMLSMEDWGGGDEFESLKGVVRAFLNDCGVIVTKTKDNHLMVRVHRGLIPLPPVE